VEYVDWPCVFISQYIVALLFINLILPWFSGLHDASIEYPGRLMSYTCIWFSSSNSLIPWAYGLHFCSVSIPGLNTSPPPLLEMSICSRVIPGLGSNCTLVTAIGAPWPLLIPIFCGVHAFALEEYGFESMHMFGDAIVSYS